MKVAKILKTIYNKKVNKITIDDMENGGTFMADKDIYNKIIFERECDIQTLALSEKLNINYYGEQNGKIIIKENEIIFESTSNKKYINYKDIVGFKPKIPFKILNLPKWWGIIFYIKQTQDEEVSSIGCVFYGEYSKEKEKFSSMLNYIKNKIFSIYTKENIVASAIGRDHKFVLYESALLIESLKMVSLREIHPLSDLKNISEIKSLPLDEVSVDIEWVTGMSYSYYCKKYGDIENFTNLIKLFINKTKNITFDAVYYGSLPEFPCNKSEDIRVNLKKDQIILFAKYSDMNATIPYDMIKKIRYETQNEINKRVTATRIALLGPYAFAFKKNESKNTKYISIELNNFNSVREASTVVLSGKNIEQLYFKLSDFCDSYKENKIKSENQHEQKQSMTNK